MYFLSKKIALKMKNFMRESKNRSRSERLIDRQLTQDDLVPEPVKKLKISETKSQINPMSTSDAISKIKKCLTQTKKIPIMIPIFRNLLKKSSSKIPADEAIFCLKAVFSSEFSDIFPLKELKELINDVQELYTDLSIEDKQFLMNALFISETFNQIFTDDSLKFHSLLREIDRKIEELEPDQELTILMGKGLALLKPFLMKTWARGPVLALLQKVYRKIKIFDNRVRELVVQMIDMKEGKKNSADVKGFDEAGFEIRDNRDFVTTVGAVDSWACKQSGLNEKSTK